MVVWRLTAVSCYLDQAPLSSLIPTSPPLLPRSPQLSWAQPWCTCNGQLWKPKPSLPPSLLLCCTMGTCFLAFTPSPDKTHRNTHTHTLAHTHIQSHPPHALVRLFLYSRRLSLSLWSRAVVIRCPRFFVCSFVAEYKGGLSPSTSLFFFFFFIRLPSPPLPFLSFFLLS